MVREGVEEPSSFTLLVILSEAKNLCSRRVNKQLPRFFAEFTLSELRRSFAALRMTAKGSE
jgi:hypothetical protein